MPKLSRDLTAGTLHPREYIFATGNLGSLNAELIIPGDGCSSISLDLRGTFSGTFEVSGTVDGTNWTLIPVRALNVASVAYVAAVTGTTAGTWVASTPAFKSIRVRCTAYTSGSATAFLAGSTAPLPDELQGWATVLLGTAVGTAGATVTLTIPAPGAGLRQYITYIAITGFAAATLTAAATPVTITTTNLPGTLALSVDAEARAQGAAWRYREDFAFPLAATAQNTAVTIVCPVATNVIWRVTAGWYVRP